MTTTRALIHLGPIKSGTTALSRYLTTASTGRTLPDHLVFPSGDLWFGKSGTIVRQRNELQCLFDGEPTVELDSTFAAISAELSGRAVDRATAIFVVETGGARLDPARTTAAFRKHFDEVDYVVMARPQTTAAASVIAQRAKMWDREHASLDPRVHFSRDDLDLTWLDYDALLTKWSPIGDEHRITFLPFLEGDQGTLAGIQRVFTAFDLGVAHAVRGIEGRRIHPTFSREGMEKLVALKNKAGRARFIPGGLARLEAEFRDTINQFHASAISNGVDPTGRLFKPWRFPDEDREWVAAHFASSNREFIARVTKGDLTNEWIAWSETAGVAK